MTEKYKKEITENWKKTGFLDGINSDSYQTTVAVMLENQKLYNQHVVEQMSPTFLVASLPLVRRIFGRLISPFLVSYQAFLGPMGLVAYKDKYDNTQRIETVVKGKVLATKFGIRNELNDSEESVNQVVELANDVAKEIDREIISDLINYSIHAEYNWRSPEALMDFILIASSKLGRGGNWVVLSADLGKAIASLPQFENDGYEADEDDVYYLGKLDRWFFYVDTNLPREKMLLGCKKGDIDSGYVYVPYICLGQIEDNPDAIVCRYGKRMINSDYYATVSINGFEGAE